jgi:hypothetical protein
MTPWLRELIAEASEAGALVENFHVKNSCKNCQDWIQEQKEIQG